MAISLEGAQQLVESVLTFDNVGDEMMAVRRKPSSQPAQERLVKQLVEYASHLGNDGSHESLSAITTAAETRVQQFAEASKRASTGCATALSPEAKM